MTCFSSLFRRRAGPRPPPGHTPEIDEEISIIHSTELYSYRELRIATDNFSAANKVGEGGFGSVYKGTLRDGTAAAVKVLSAESRQGKKEFLTEINVIANIEHDNLVKLHGCCAEENHRILVYGYLENNSFAQTLLGGKHTSIHFSWSTRCKISIGVARGLAYLHEEVQPHIIHRDIKASNILLDKQLNPKISDFGLAKLFPAHLTHISTRVAGTAGYLAPEYAIRGQLTRKADIYSFGVLILEIVSGRSNTNRRLPPEDQYLLERAWEFYEKGELVNLVDTSLDGDFDADEACRYMKIGLFCTQDVLKLRPSMSSVVKMLTNEINVNDMKVSRPGLLGELMGHKGRKSETHKSGAKLSTSSSFVGTGKLEDTSSSGMATSYATMTYSSVFDRN